MAVLGLQPSWPPAPPSQCPVGQKPLCPREEVGLHFLLFPVSQTGKSCPTCFGTSCELAQAKLWQPARGHGAHTKQNIFLQTNGKAQRKQQLWV